MPYVDETYYNDVYKGVPISGGAFSSLSERASGVIDRLTAFRLKYTPFEDQPQFVQDMVKMATAAQIEYMSANGGAQMVHGSSGLGNVNVGNFSYQDGAPALFSPTVIDYLNASGLLYSGVSING